MNPSHKQVFGYVSKMNDSKSFFPPDVRIQFSSENRTRVHLRDFVSKYFELGDKEYKFLDLGRIMDGNEKLRDLKRTSFTLYIRD